MASLILDDKIEALRKRIEPKGITLSVTPEAYSALLKEGFSPEYGAREIERTVNSRLTPLLMKEILFGRKEGFEAIIDVDKDEFVLK